MTVMATPTAPAPAAPRCEACGRPIRKGTRGVPFRYADGTRGVRHKACHHRATVDPDTCRCRTCTGDLGGF